MYLRFFCFQAFTSVLVGVDCSSLLWNKILEKRFYKSVVQRIEKLFYKSVVQRIILLIETTLILLKSKKNHNIPPCIFIKTHIAWNEYKVLNNKRLFLIRLIATRISNI